jgi:NAD(P)-dependent dehydrogenase (short-subunit alcohol dehydrogenase family)
VNIVIVGCGNVGFEAARLLCGDHNLLLVNRSLPADVAQFVREHGNVSFARADATDPLGVEQALTGFGAQADRVDVLLSTVGAFCSTSALDDFHTFARDFHLNFFGNLVPIQAVLNRMIAAHTGRIVVLSSTSGVFTYPGLTAYAPAKWALTAFCRTLRNEVRRYGVSVDMVFPASIRNRRSRTFLYKNGIEVKSVATEIGRLLKVRAGADRFVPGRYSLLRSVEQMLPQVLDRRAGLKRDRRRRFCDQRVNTVLLLGASSGLGRELAILYAKVGQRLYLVESDARALSELKRRIELASACAVEVVDGDVADHQSGERLADQLPNIDLVICIPEGGTARQIRDVSPADYERSLTTCFLGPVRLAVALLRRHKISSKVITVLSTAPLEGRPGYSCYAAGQAALWSFTRSLRRTVGNDLQVMEVLIRETGKGLTDVAAAEQIRESERAGREMVVLPSKAALSMYLGAIAPQWYERLLSRA